MSRLFSITVLAVSMITVGYADLAAARQNRGGRTASNSESTSASTDIRLRAKFEVEAEDDAEVEIEDTAPEFHADYRMKKGVPRLQVRVENIELGTEVSVVIGDMNIGSAIVEADGIGTEAALDFRGADFPAGLTISEGSMCRIYAGEQLLFEAPFQVK